MAKGSITLGDVADRTDILTVACSRCDRAGRYPLATLIEKHEPGFDIPDLLRRLSADCSKRASVSTYDLCGIHLCGIHCPGLPALFGVSPGR